jgi:hypothetical protein
LWSFCHFSEFARAVALQLTTSLDVNSGTGISEQVCGSTIRQAMMTSWAAMARLPSFIETAASGAHVEAF